DKSSRLVSSGAGVLVGELFGVAYANAAKGSSVVIGTAGVWVLPSAGEKDAKAVKVGDPIGWDGAVCVAGTDSNSKARIGVCVGKEGSSSLRVLLGR
ncbi:MAG: DUF2190 family protein, partial [Pseudomonadota bacterium]